MYSRAFQRAIEETLGREGLYSDNPNDPGGKTMYGITETLAREYGFNGLMEDLSLERATEIYHAHFWARNRLDDVAAIDERIAFEVFDTSVNMGRYHGVRFLQRLLRVFNRGQKHYPNIVADGLIGPKTIEALRLFVKHRGQVGADVMLSSLNGLQAAEYVQLAELREKNEQFVFGWIAQRCAIPEI